MRRFSNLYVWRERCSDGVYVFWVVDVDFKRVSKVFKAERQALRLREQMQKDYERYAAAREKAW